MSVRLKKLIISMSTLTFFLSLDILSGLDASAAGPQKNVASAGQTEPLHLQWKAPADKTLRYDFAQRVEISSNVGQPPKAPLQISGELQARSIKNSGQTELLLDATRLDLQTKDAQAKAQKSTSGQAAPKTSGADKGRTVHLDDQSGNSSVTQAAKRPAAKSKNARGFFSCSPPPPAKKVAPAPKAFSTAPKARPRPAMTPRLHARFVIDKDGKIRGSGASTGGQTELMVRLLFPLPAKDLKVGEEEKSEIDVSPVGRRFPMMGHRRLKIEEILDVKGQRCARVVASVEMKGEGRGASKPGAASQMKGTMTLTATTRGLFAIDAGYYREAQTELDFSMNTERMVSGSLQKVSLKQHQSSSLVLRDVAQKAKKSPVKNMPAQSGGASAR